MDVEQVVEVVSSTFDNKDLTLNSVLHVIILLLLGMLIIRFVMKMVDKMLSRRKSLGHVKPYILSAVRVFLWLLLILMLAETLDVKVTSIIAMLSVVGLALSLALQNTLANLAGGIVLLVTKPFVLGDFVEADGICGTIAHVSLVYTTFTTPDNKEIFVPNSQLSATKIINYNTLGRRRMDVKFTASYNTPTARVRAAIEETFASIPGILDDPAPVVYVSEYQPSRIEYLARLWTPAGDYWVIYFALLEGVRESFARHGVEMTHDHLNVHIVEK